MPEWAEICDYLHDSEAALFEELKNCRNFLHENPEGGWTAAQIVHHLVRTEKMMYPMWVIVPKLRRFPQLIDGLDRFNSALWKRAGMRTVESAGEKLTPANATKGRFRAPFFLNPSKVLNKETYEDLVALRWHVRHRSLRAITAISPELSKELSWSHPLFGRYTLNEFTMFLGVHERHHVPQIRRIRESRH